MTVIHASAFDCAYGSSKSVGSTASNYQLRWSQRLVDVAPSTTGLAVLLPDARGFAYGTGYDRRATRTGGPHFCILNSGANSLAIKDAAGGTVASVSAGSSRVVWLVEGATAAGTWFADAQTTFSKGAALATTRFQFDYTIDVSRNQMWYLPDYMRAAGWNDTDPVAVRLEVNAGLAVGSNDTAYPAIYVDNLPAGSSVLLINRGMTIGKGGAGGRGSISALLLGGANGSPGGPAIQTWWSMAIANLDTIAAGGGGGGGGGGSGTANNGDGGGGGGGRGHGDSLGGASYGPALPGTRGNANTNGVGGAPSSGNGGAGGAGGLFGAAGDSGVGGSSSTGGAGGAGGTTILRKPSATITWITTGSRPNYAEATF